MANGNEASDALKEWQKEQEGEEEKTDLDKILADLGFYDYAQKMGIDISPSASELKKLLKAIIDEGTTLGNQNADEIAAIDAQISELGDFSPRVSQLVRRKQELLAEREQEQREFWAQYAPYINTMRTAFTQRGGIGGGITRAEQPSDPLELYFQAVERLQAEVLGPDPESRFLNVPGVAEAISTTTPTDFQQFLQGQQKELQARYLADVFQQFGPDVQQFAGELAKLPEYDEASNSYPRLERFLELRDTLGLDQIPTFETFIEEKTPELQSRFKYLRPLSDEEVTAAFRNVFGEEIGEGGGQITPFGTFAQRQQEALATEFSDLIRGQLKAGAELEKLPSFEEFLGGQREELERSFKLSSPYITGRKRPGTLGRKQRIL